VATLGQGKQLVFLLIFVLILVLLIVSCLLLQHDSKTTLVNQIKKPLKESQGSFIQGKFEMSETRPDTVLFTALNSFFGQILEEDARGNTDMSMRWRVHDAIGGSGNNILLKLIPNLRIWMDTEEDTDDNVKGMGSSHRLQFLFCQLIGAIACREHPLVLFLDDLQESPRLYCFMF
jgi:histidine kinase